MKFRTLRANEIEARFGQDYSNGITLLLYKDARCDMNILDETVGAENWQRNHKEIKGNMYAGVAIWDDKKSSWIWKWDCGTESRTEKEKGEASDSFKRACVNWGIGRELYNSPFIFINKTQLEYEGNRLKTRFVVTEFEVDENKNVSRLEIQNSAGKVLFNYPKNSEAKAEEQVEEKPAEKQKSYICSECGRYLTTSMTKKGEEISVNDVAAISNERYGRFVCADCMKAMKNES